MDAYQMHLITSPSGAASDIHLGDNLHSSERVFSTQLAHPILPAHIIGRVGTSPAHDFSEPSRVSQDIFFYILFCDDGHQPQAQSPRHPLV
jgi:hypothetical protein